MIFVTAAAVANERKKVHGRAQAQKTGFSGVFALGAIAAAPDCFRKDCDVIKWHFSISNVYFVTHSMHKRNSRGSSG
jgi:hypothetical protein